MKRLPLAPRIAILTILTCVLLLVLASPALAKEKTRITGLKSSYSTSAVHLVITGTLSRYHNRKWVAVPKTKLVYVWGADRFGPTRLGLKTDSKGRFKVDVSWLGKGYASFAGSRTLGASKFVVKNVSWIPLTMPIRISVPSSASVVDTGGVWHWRSGWDNWDGVVGAGNGSTPALDAYVYSELGGVETTIVETDFTGGNGMSGLNLEAQQGDGTWLVAEDGCQFMPDSANNRFLVSPDPVNPNGAIDEDSGVPSVLPYTEVDHFRLTTDPRFWLMKNNHYYRFPAGITVPIDINFTFTN